jgi:diacylglycerol O-acyltransferase
VQRLSGFDAWLLYSESPSAHQHTLKIVELADTPEHPFSVEHLRRRFARRLHLLEPLRCVLAEVPYGLHHPMWLQHSDVDLDYHLREITLPAPGGPEQLDEVVSGIVSAPLDRSRPLWEMYVVTGRADGRISVVTKMHHALADGLASANLLARAVQDYPDEALAKYQPVPPDPVPPRREILRMALADHRDQLRALPGLLRRTAAGVRRLRAHAPTPPPGSANVLRPDRIFTNGALSPARRFTATTLPLDEVTRVRRALGVTLNDVVLGLAAGAMRRLLLDVQGRADRPLVASVPVSTDLDPERISGNRLGGMLVSLPVQLTDPVQRCRAAGQAATVAKEQTRLLGREMMQDWLEYVPPRPFAWYTRFSSRRRSADRGRPRMNLVVSTVPGPKEQIHIAGYPMAALFSVGPLYEGCGLNVTVWTYRDQLNISVLTDPDLVPDAGSVTAAFSTAFAELGDAVEALRP